MGELLLEAGNRNLASVAIKKEKRYEHRVTALIDAEAWKDAVEEAFTNKKHAEFEGFLEKIQEKGPPFVSDFITDNQNKRK
jgi:molybdopterin-guanine dinucleotide biosynthesis protein A